MTAGSLDALLDKLCSGDADAAEQAFLAYEPYLRMVVRRLLPSRLRPKFDSVDVVQSVWADVWQGFQDSDWHFRNADQLKAFLITATRNRFIDRIRRFGDKAARERPLELMDEPSPAGDPRPSQVVEADELWQQMLALCPPAHHELLRLKRAGCSLEEIASRTGLHKSSVRRVLYDLARRLGEANQKPR